MARPNTALVLSGGGSRGAYEVGVLLGLAEVLGLRAEQPAPFDIFAGTSVGAINSTFLASHAERGDMGVHGLVDLWRNLDLARHARLDLAAFRSRALLQVAPIEALVRDSIDWTALHRQTAAGALRSVVLATLHVGSGRTVMFAQVAPGVDFRPSRDPRRMAINTTLTANHVLASAAIPGVFPPRRIDRSLYYDGSMRFNTPLAPAIRSGAERVLVVSPLHEEASGPAREPDALHADEGHAPSTIFLLGKMLNALLLDPLAYDIQVLERFNGLIGILDAEADPETRRRFDEATVALRGAAYRSVDALVIRPSADIGALGAAYLQAHRRRLAMHSAAGLMLAALATRSRQSASDLMSYLLFDGGFAEQLIALGRADAHAKAEGIRAFFGGT
jgi:NTE family protein